LNIDKDKDLVLKLLSLPVRYIIGKYVVVCSVAIDGKSEDAFYFFLSWVLNRA